MPERGSGQDDAGSAPAPITARDRAGAIATVLAMLATVGPAVGSAIGRGSTVGLFPPDLGAAVVLSLLGAFLLVRGATASIAVILCASGAGAAITTLTGFVRDTAALDGPLRGWTLWAAWVNQWVWLPGVVLLGPLLLLFPDGRLPGRRWRLVYGALGVSTAAELFCALSARQSLVEGKPERFAPNPTGWIRFGGVHVLNLIGGVMFAVLLVSIALSLGALLARRRHAQATARAQVTSLLYGGALTLVLIVVVDSLPENASTFALGLFAVTPVAGDIAVAVLRYRLYDVDRIVSRTLAYALVLAVLAGVYVGVVLALSALVPHRYGQVGVAGATLAVTALAVPVTRRVRVLVDRRFNRRRYDADRLVEHFAGRLRSGLDPEQAATALLEVAGRAVEPRLATIWMAPR